MKIIKMGNKLRSVYFNLTVVTLNIITFMPQNSITITTIIQNLCTSLQ